MDKALVRGRTALGLLARLALGACLLALLAPGAAQARDAAPTRPAFTLISPTLRDGVEAAQLYDGPGCGGGNVSPVMQWSGLPPGTRSLALTLFDRDARGGAGWWHWAVLDIPASASGLPLGAGSASGQGLPGGARQLRTSFGSKAYGGPCPPPGSGVHHYEFTLWALPVATLSLPAGAGAAELAARAAAAAIGHAHLQVRFGR